MKTKRRVATVLFVFQILALTGFETQTGYSAAEQIGYYLGYFAPLIIGVLLLKSAKKDEFKDEVPEGYEEYKSDKEIYDEFSDY